MGTFDYTRRNTSQVKVGDIFVGGNNPIRIQTMTNTSTNAIEYTFNQIKKINDAGAEIVRLTAQGVREVNSIAIIKNKLEKQNIKIPIVADIHFNTAAAFAAADIVDKVRINPGNFVDPGRTFRKIEYTDEEYTKEISILEKKVLPFYELCKENNVAVRIGVNHGSLSDRIMSRYGDTPEGSVESAMEFLRIAAKINFSNIVVSIKSSNTLVMVETVRRLVEAMKNESLYFPIHLGVTEAGNGEDGRIKSAIGIGTLLYQGIGDTIRVSLSEAPENEIPVANELINYITSFESAPKTYGTLSKGFDPFCPKRRQTFQVGCIGGNCTPIVLAENDDDNSQTPLSPDVTDENIFLKIDTEDQFEKIIESINNNLNLPLLLTSRHINRIAAIKSLIHKLNDYNIKNPIVVSLNYPPEIEKWKVVVRASADFGALLIDKLIDGINIKAPSLNKSEIINLSFGILQGARARITRTEYIACPGCGRTLFDLEKTIDQIKKATSHLKNLKIGIMGCIVNGPGEMADADYGYVGAAKGKISLYKGKQCIEKNVDQGDAVKRLIKLIKEDNRWENI